MTEYLAAQKRADDAEADLAGECDCLRALSRSEQRRELLAIFNSGKARRVGQLLELLGLPPSFIITPPVRQGAAELENLKARGFIT